MKTLYDIGDKVELKGVVIGIQITQSESRPTYTIKVPGDIFGSQIHIKESTLERMDGNKHFGGGEDDV